MAALNRLSQRIKENFQETTRDFSLLSGSGSTNNGYFDTSDDKIKEIGVLLESRHDKERLEGMKRIIAGMSKGRDMEPFYAQVVKNVVAPSIEIRKLVYIYLLRFASTNSDLVLLSINTFQKDLSDPSPLIRSMSLRVLTSIRVPVIQGIVMLGLQKLVNDRNPYVRKTVAGGLAKVYEMDPSSLSSLLSLLQTLIASPSPLTLGASLTAFSEICPDRLDLLHPYFRHICRMLVDVDEWGQVVAVQVLCRYARAMLEKPDETSKAKSDESDDEFEGLDIDLAMLLDCARPLFQSRNPAVVLAVARAYYHLAPAGHKHVGQELLVKPLLRIAGSPRLEEVSSIAWAVIAAMAEARPWLFKSYWSSTLLSSADSAQVQASKMRTMVVLVDATSAEAALKELKYYTRLPLDAVAETAVREIGTAIARFPSIASTGLSTLMKLLRSHRDNLVAEAVIALKTVILALPASVLDNAVTPARLVARLAKQLPTISNARARASIFWLVGQYAGSDTPPSMGIGWEGVQAWVPDVLRQAVKGFKEESGIVKLQILTCATKVLVLSPLNSQLTLLHQYLFTLARYDKDYDVRDRARYLAALTRGITAEEETDMGGVVLRREQIKLVLFVKAVVARKNVEMAYEVGTLSAVLNRKVLGYEALPEWTDDPTDGNLRESEIEKPARPAPAQAISSQPISRDGTPPVQHSSSTMSVPRTGISVGTSPAGSLPTAARSKFQDLDAFLNSDSESEETESEDEPQVHIVATADCRDQREHRPAYAADAAQNEWARGADQEYEEYETGSEETDSESDG